MDPSRLSEKQKPPQLGLAQQRRFGNAISFHTDWTRSHFRNVYWKLPKRKGAS
jgi:hypothetical protein